ncbi:Mu homology domain-containing protein [Entophlyctis helioformis]|nr:Mu homology domain-containing protein [Entophlyctis helioformis]
MLDSLFVVDASGSVIIEKHWKQLVPRRVIDEFVALAQAQASPDEVPPVMPIETFFLLHIHRHGLLFVAALSSETSPSSVYFFLQRIVDLFMDYFGSVSEITLKDNFVIVYELLEELVDYGSPYITEPCLLKEMIPPPSLLSNVMNAVSIGTQFGPKEPTGAVSTIPWRAQGIKHSANEIFFDIIEELDVILDRRGKLVAGTILGTILCNSKLSGMPDLILALGNKHVISEGLASVHPCVRVARFERDRILSFVPPDGTFRLMDYNVPMASEQMLPIQVKPTIKLYKGGGKLDITIQPKVPSSKNLENVAVSVTLPSDVASVRTTPNIGQCSFDPKTKVLKWTVGKVAGDLSSTGIPLLSAQLLADAAVDLSTSKKSITFAVEFRINMFSSSGLRIESLAVQNEAYTPFKAGRGYTKAGRFHMRFL